MKLKKNRYLLIIFFFSIPLYSQSDNSNMNMVYEKDRYQQKLSLNYSLRWDFKDMTKFYLLPFSIYNTAFNMDFSRDVKLKYYGYKISPFKLIVISDKKKKLDGETNTSEKSSNQDNRPKKRKYGINLSALYDNLEENINNLILDNSFKSISPEWKNISRNDKKEFIKDLLKLDIFNNPLLNPIGSQMEKISQTKDEDKLKQK